MYRLLTLMEQKGSDYASREDTLQNFKQVAEIAGVLQLKDLVHRPTGIALLYMLLKIQRLANLLRSQKEAVNEPLEDTFDDLVLYTLLCKACMIDEHVGE